MEIFKKLKKVFAKESTEEMVNKWVGNISSSDEYPILELGCCFDVKFCKLLLLKMKEKGFELITAGAHGSADWTSQVLYFKRIEVRG